MKKLFILLFLPLSSLSFLTGQSLKIGVGPGFSTGFPFGNLSESYNKSGNVNFFLKGVYSVKEPLSFSPSLTFFLPRASGLTYPLEERKITINVMMFDFNGHYSFFSGERINFFGLAGFDILLASKKEVIQYDNDPITHIKTTFTSKVNDNGLGLNAGAGISFKISEKLYLFSEGKYLLFTKYKAVFSKYNQVIINAGVLLNINIQQKNQNKGG